MKNKELYDKTIGILVDAYFNDTLKNGNCYACAVGNLVASNNGYELIIVNESAAWCNKAGRVVSPKWDKVICSRIESVFGFVTSVKQVVDLDNYQGVARKQIESTGYGVVDFGKIEIAFEKGYNKNFVRDRMYSGLMAVVDALNIIHGNTDVALTSQSKQKFNKKATI